MTKREMGEILAVLQDHFSIRPDYRINFATEAGELHSGRVIFALGRCGIEASLETMSLLCERMEKTPPTGAKLVDALIDLINAAAAGEAVESPQTPERKAEVWRGDSSHEQKLTQAELARIAPNLIRMGIDPEAPVEIQRKQFRQWIVRTKEGLARELAQGSRPTPHRKPPSREQAEKALAAACSARRPPEHLNPEALALATFANGDERGNEWE